MDTAQLILKSVFLFELDAQYGCVKMDKSCKSFFFCKLWFLLKKNMNCNYYFALKGVQRLTPANE